MRRTSVLLALPALAVLCGVPAAWADSCFGTSRAAVCVAPQYLPTVEPNGSSIDECVYTGGDECEPVSVPVPTVEFGDGGAVVYCKPSCEVSGS